MKKLHVLIFRSYLGPALATFAIVIFVLLMNFLWKYVDELVGKGLDWHIIMKLMFYASFSFVPTALPISVLLASLMTMGNLGEHYELVAMKSSGISLRKILMPLGILAFLISVGAFFYANYMSSYANLKFRSTLEDVRRTKLAFNLREGIFNSSMDGYVIKADKKSGDGSILHKVMIYDHSKMQGANKLIIADSGIMKKTNDGNYLLITLLNGANYEEGRDETMQKKMPFQRINFKKETIKFDLSQFKINKSDEDFFKKTYIALKIDELKKDSDSIMRDANYQSEQLKSSVKSNFITLSRLNFTNKLFDSIKPDEKNNKRYLSLLTKNKKRVSASALRNAEGVKTSLEFPSQAFADKKELSARYMNEWHRKFTLSIACLAFFLIGAPLGAIIRKGGLGLPLIISVFLFVFYYIISLIGEKASRTGLSPWLGMWLSTYIFMPVGIFLLYKASIDSNLMNFENYKAFFIKLFNKVKAWKKRKLVKE